MDTTGSTTASLTGIATGPTTGSATGRNTGQVGEHARDVFEEEAAHGFDPRLRGIRGTFRFDVIDVGSWYVAIDDGRVAIREDAEAPADCIVEGAESDLVAILTGELRAIIAFMQGRVRFRGDMALFTRFHGWAGTEPSGQSIQPIAEKP